MKLALITETTSKDEAETVRDAPPAGELGQYITGAQAAEIIGVSMARVRQLAGEGRIKGYEPTDGQRDRMFKRADIEAFAKKPRERTGRPDEGKGTSDKK